MSAYVLTISCVVYKPPLADAAIFRRILDLVWETLVVKDAKVNFDLQLEKLEEAIPAADDYNFYGVYPAIDARVALSELLHSCLSGETLAHAVTVSETSIHSVAMVEMTQAEREMTEGELNALPAIAQELGCIMGNLPFIGGQRRTRH